ncbi:MAG: MoxR family ATPase [Candidatus Limnocylindrales bacterium]
MTDGQRLWTLLKGAVSQAVVGQDAALRSLATCLLAEGHALVEDVPGVGKTLLARAFAQALALDFGRIQGTPDLLPSDMTGTNILQGQQFHFVAGPIFTNVLLVDEVNRATPRAQSALLEAMQERQVSVDGQTRPLPEPFVVLATQNPIELEGTFSLPEAQLDRFLMRIHLGYPGEEEEQSIASRYDRAAEPLDAVTAVVSAADLAGLIDAARTVHVSAEVESYLVRLVRATRKHPAVTLGGSPRASVALHRACQASALLDGRTFVRPEDVRELAPSVLGHRLVLDIDRQMRGVTVAGVIDEVIAEVSVPPVLAEA